MHPPGIIHPGLKIFCILYNKMAQATALHETNGKVFVLCPHCEAIHEHEAATTPRLIEIDAACDTHKRYTIGATMKPRNFKAAIHLYEYELARKRTQYQRRKATTGSPDSE